jgi:penicillin-binding protein 2
MRKAIAESCDVYFYTIGGGYKNQPGLGPSRIKKYLELFGWGNKTQIDLPGESEGFIPSPTWKKETKKENWWDGDTYNLSIGQGDILITPLQVATAFVAIANGGTLFQPQVVKQIIDNNKNVIEEIPSKILRENFIDPENLQVVREGMRMGVTGEGAPLASASSLNYLPVKVAVKTGTAETSKPNYYHKWITVFAPYDDPQIVLTIMIESVRDTQPTAIPVAKEVLNWYFGEHKK